MCREFSRRRVAGLLALLWLLVQAGSVWADADADFRQLAKQCLDQVAAGKADEAQKTALAMRQMAEVTLKDKPSYLAAASTCQAKACESQKHYKEAEELYKEALGICERTLDPNSLDAAKCLENLAQIYGKEGRTAEARTMANRAQVLRQMNESGVAKRDTAAGTTPPVRTSAKVQEPARTADEQPRAEAPKSADRAQAAPQPSSSRVGKQNGAIGASSRAAASARVRQLTEDFNRQTSEKKYREAERTVIELRHAAEAEGATLYEALACCWQGILYDQQGRYAEAEPLLKQALDIAKQALGPDDRGVLAILEPLATLHAEQGRYAEAEPLYQQALDIGRRAFGPKHPSVAKTLTRLGILYRDQGRYAEAEPLFKQALEIYGSVPGRGHIEAIETLNNLAILYVERGRFAEAEPLFKRALEIGMKASSDEGTYISMTLGNLANLYRIQGRYADAERLYKQVLEIERKTLGPDHPDVGKTLGSLATLYAEQGRNTDAMPLFRQALQLRMKALGPRHPDIARILNNLACACKHLNMNAEAEQFFKQAISIYRAALGADHPELARTVANLADFYNDAHRWADAELLYKGALEIRRQGLGPEHPEVAKTLYHLANLYVNQGRYADAEPLMNQAIAIQEKGEPNSVDRARGYWFRSELSWKAGRKAPATADLEHALELVETARSQTSGEEMQQAAFFGQWLEWYETMAVWQAELGNLPEVLTAIERCRARGLTDQMETHGMDLLAGVPEGEATKLRQRENQAEGQVASLRKQLQIAGDRKDHSPEERRAEFQKLRDQMRDAQQQYAAAYADIRNASPAYRLAVGKDRKPVTLEELKTWVGTQEALLLEYMAGVDGGHVFVLAADGTPRLEELTLSSEQAKILGIEPGPLTAKLLGEAMINAKGTGVLQRLKEAKTAEKTQAAVPGLAALWQVVIPEAERTAILEQKFKRLIVIPDGPLAQLPFEALVTQPGDEPRYLLDAGLPIEYAPSATILVNLATRPAEKRSDATRPPVLSVGNPRYGEPLRPAAENLLAQVTAGSRYTDIGGKLAALPYTKKELEWVSHALGESGLAVTQLQEDQATEARVRAEVMGRELIHLACHGLVDQAHGNLFGALALTPGPDPTNPADDGYLTLAEVYALNLKGCELVILSACETNVGPEQRGEGLWALSRGFLVAGSRRVVASNWLVDDEAAARLVYYYCGILMRDRDQGGVSDHAAALCKAKRGLRQEPQWKSPYYWAPFVLLGPK